MILSSAFTLLSKASCLRHLENSRFAKLETEKISFARPPIPIELFSNLHSTSQPGQLHPTARDNPPTPPTQWQPTEHPYFSLAPSAPTNPHLNLGLPMPNIQSNLNLKRSSHLNLSTLIRRISQKLQSQQTLNPFC